MFSGFGKGKIMRPPERKQETCETGGLKGCGNPNCDICMPKDRPQDAGGAKFSPPDFSLTIDLGAAPTAADIEKIKAAFRANMVDGIVNIFRVPPESVVPISKDNAQRAAFAKEERELRGPIERFLLKTEHQVQWDDVVGNTEAKRALLAAIEHPITHAALFAHYKKTPGKGVLLYGPPGCGKTMFGKAAASALAKLHGRAAPILLKINGPEIQSPYVGVTEAVIRAIFAYARAFKRLHGDPLVVFIDEADAILPSRDGAGGRRALPWEESQVATFLTEMDGLEDSGAFVILASNRPRAIDAAILRDGRIDRRIKIERPGPDAVAVFLEQSFAGVPLADGERHEHLVFLAFEELYSPDRRLLRLKSSRGIDYLRLRDALNGAMIVGLVERAKEIAFARDLAAGGAPSGITAADVMAAIDAMQREQLDVDQSAAIDDFAAALGHDALTVEPLRDVAGGGGRRQSRVISTA